MRRVLVIGCSGAGKSTFSRKLAAVLDVPVVHIDQLFWRPGWVPAPRDEFVTAVAKATAGERWVMDGNSPSTFDLRFPLADRVVWFRYNRLVCLWRVCRRVLASHGRVRADMAPGCPERFDWEFMKYIWRFDAKYTPLIETAIEKHGVAHRLAIVRSDRETDALLHQLATPARVGEPA